MAPRTPASRVSLHALALTVVFLAVGIPSGNAWAKKFTSTIREGTAFRDRVKNGQPDDGEKRTTTATDGSFSLANGKGRVYLRGGFDVQTGLPNTQLLTTPPGTKAIGSLTALWQALRDRKQPVAKVKKMLNLKGGVTAVNYVAKPIETVKPKIKGLIKRNAQHQTFVQFLKSLAQAKKTLRVAATAEAGTCPAGTSTEDDAIAALACALIGLEPGKKKDWSALDLTNPETVKSLFSSSLTELGITLPEDSKLTILANATADLMKKIEEGTTDQQLALLAQLAAAEARLVAAGRYDDLNNVAFRRTPVLLAVVPDTGSDLADAVTNNSNPALTGVVGSGATRVRIYQGEVAVADIDVGADGVWSYTPGGTEGLQDGSYSFVFSSLDAGDPPAESPQSPVTRLVIDTVAPAAAAVTPLQTNETTPTVTGTWRPEDSLTVAVNGVTYSGSDISFTGETGWSLTIPDANALPVGDYDVTTTVTDLAGNVTTDVAKAALKVQAAPVGLFGSATAASVGAQPIAVVRGDFNQDGKVDLAVANQAGNSISLMLGNGDGTFQAAQTIAAGNGPYSLVAADVNRAGGLDLVVANSADDTVSILAGNGDGTFAAPVNLATGNTPYLVALLGDVNFDNYPDIATANVNGSSVSILLSDGQGGYAATPQTITGLGNPDAVAAADVNGDGSDDLIVGNSSGGNPVASVLLSNGDGGFLAKTDYPVGGGVTGLALGDLDADGWPDIVTANNAGNTVSVLLNSGGSGFAGQVTYPAGTQARNVAIGDIDGDGRPDLAVTSAAGNSVGILSGIGDGTFRAAQSFPTGQTPWGLNLGDLNGDAKPDLAVANWGSDSVSILLNQRTGNLFQTKTDYPVASAPYAIGAADLNGDSSVDLVSANQGSLVGQVMTPGSVSVILNGGSGSFAGHVDYATQTNVGFGSMVLGLLDGDTLPDVMVTNNLSSSLSFLKGAGSGTLADQLPYLLQSPPSGMVAGLLDGDLALDLVVLNGAGIDVYTSNGQVAVPSTPTFNYPVSGTLEGAVLAQLDGTGGLDLAVTNTSTSGDQLLVFSGNSADGSFGASPVPYPTGTTPVAVAAGDVNKDGSTDLVVANLGSNTVSLFRGGDGFSAKRDFPVGLAPRSVALADLNGDANLDMIVASEAAASVSVLIGNGSGGFWAPVPYPVGGFAFSLAVADFNGDSKLDVATGNWGTNSVSVLLNASPSSPVSLPKSPSSR